PPPPGYPPGGYPPAEKGGSGVIIAVVAVVLVLVLGGGAVAFFLTRDSGDDEADDPPSTTTEDDGPEAEPLLLQQASDAGPDPFGASFTDSDLPELSNAARSSALERRSQLTADSSGALLGTGDTPGLYGGSRDNRVCDALAIADFLEGEAEKGAAFAEVLGIETGDIRDYLGSLTPVVLASDTWVTNHGFADGEATSFQAVLEAGTAVLVDDTGVPRVRCSCGNPLTPPDREGRSTDATDGADWEGYEPDQVTVVSPGSQLSTITLIDVESGEEFDRAVGAGQSGDVQVTLQWTGDADLDLHVFDPEEFEIYFGTETSPSGGELDVDVIPGCDTPPESHTENVFWATGTAPGGDYRVVIENYDGCDAETTEFDLQVVIDGVVEISETGSVAPDAEGAPYPFSVA
ncbi:MAG TPA: DUF6777 domain-containing protein, partial [Iamia sp.]|nr:DUF6777 domain-containing protein [Iamia sp.]